LAALIACIVDPKVWHRAGWIVFMAILTFCVCSSIIGAHSKVAMSTFRIHHARPLKAYLLAVQSDVATGETDAATQKLSTAIQKIDTMWLHSTNATFRTINQELGISEQAN